MTTVNLSLLNNEAFLSGELTRQTIAFIEQSDIQALLNKEKAVLNLKGVNKIDTAGLAWLFELVENAQKQNCSLTFSDLPNQLDKLITLSGVEGFLPL